ncbi:MAG TPA: hypothetical protein VFI68_06555 [Anaerolineales bacterium]|nr:hypothetical protein [Anaerolineales bacterium]
MSNERSNFGRRDFFKLTGGAVGIAALSYYLGLTDRPRPASPTDDLPDYADGDLGFPVFRTPYFQKDSQLAAFLFRADVASLTTLCDQNLNSLQSSPYQYIPLTSSVMLVYADMLVSSLDERDAGVGFIPETEAGFWILTAAMKKTSTGQVPHHLAWFLPYLLVDEGNSIATGREVYGFNKQAGEFNKVQDITSPQFSADVLGFRQFDPSAIARKERLLELNPLSNEKAQSKWKDWSAAKRDLKRGVLDNIRPDLAGGIVGFAARAITDNIPLVFLKQFRPSSNSKKAAYKTIVEAPLKVKGFYDGGLFSQPHKLTLNHLDSHPFARKLGLKNEQTSTLGAWMKVDFVLDHGVEL